MVWMTVYLFILNAVVLFLGMPIDPNAPVLPVLIFNFLLSLVVAVTVVVLVGTRLRFVRSNTVRFLIPILSFFGVILHFPFMSAYTPLAYLKWKSRKLQMYEKIVFLNRIESRLTRYLCFLLYTGLVVVYGLGFGFRIAILFAVVDFVVWLLLSGDTIEYPLIV